MNGAQVLQAAIIGNAPTAWTIAATGDFNGDGKSDILWRDTGGNVAIGFMNGAQLSSAAGVGNVSTVWSIQGAMPTDVAIRGMEPSQLPLLQRICYTLHSRDRAH